MYVCVSIEHLGLNMAMQLLVGVPLEMVHGAARIGLIYVCGVLAGKSQWRCSLYFISQCILILDYDWSGGID